MYYIIDSLPLVTGDREDRIKTLLLQNIRTSNRAEENNDIIH